VHLLDNEELINESMKNLGNNIKIELERTSRCLTFTRFL